MLPVVYTVVNFIVIRLFNQSVNQNVRESMLDIVLHARDTAANKIGHCSAAIKILVVGERQ